MRSEVTAEAVQIKETYIYVSLEDLHMSKELIHNVMYLSYKSSIIFRENIEEILGTIGSGGWASI